MRAAWNPLFAQCDRVLVCLCSPSRSCSLLGCNTGLHAAGRAELLRRRGARPERLHQRHQEQEGPHRRHRPAPVRYHTCDVISNGNVVITFQIITFTFMTPPPLLSRVSRPSGTGDLHRSDSHFFRKTLLGLALFLVLHHRLGGHHIGFCSRYFFFFTK